jgi:hypothetical protein
LKKSLEGPKFSFVVFKIIIGAMKKDARGAYGYLFNAFFKMDESAR